MVKAVYQLLTEYVYCLVMKPDVVFCLRKGGRFLNKILNYSKSAKSNTAKRCLNNIYSLNSISIL